ncbi:prepilin peptidase [Gayadomonas joobiniege]|uniref:prepilin peptidase n=1 Tax=Gayadomonas joobiniege TaxID=1234606 RepID=UPI00037D7CF7|nr:A24 family peptidase [Gayadomonas joobiniege]
MSITTLINAFEQSPVFFFVCVFIFSILVGSFLNVVIYRLPRMLESNWRSECEVILNQPPTKTEPVFNLVQPASTCPHCQTKIKPWFNVPIVGWLILRGRCAECQQPISPRYPLIELAAGLLALVAAWHFGVSLATLWALIFTFALLTLFFIDFDTMLLPDEITLPLLWLGLLINLNGTFATIESAVIGATVGYLSLWSIFWLFKLVTGKEGMGYGDFKLLAALGAWMGWQALIPVILISSVVGAILGFILLKVQQKDSQQAMPFGPYLAVAGWISFYWREALTHFYLHGWLHG